MKQVTFKVDTTYKELLRDGVTWRINGEQAVLLLAERVLLTLTQSGLIEAIVC